MLIRRFTRKYRFDQENWLAVTLNLPSDREEGSGGLIMTHKYPSDQENS